MPVRVLERAKQAEHSFMVLMAVIVGCLGGIGAVLFRLLIQAVQKTAWGELPFSIDLLRSVPDWRVVLVPAIGGLIVGPLVYYLAREAKGHGVPEVMEAVAMRAGVIRPRLVIVKSLASAISIGTGGSVGREGPIVQIGSALGSSVGQLMRLSGNRLRTLVGCGAAAGIAATFNAPIAGALFAAEVILGEFVVTQFTPIVISSVVATVISRHYLGDVPAFVVPQYILTSPWELAFYAVLGVLAAFVALGFVRFLYLAEDAADRLPLPPWLLAAVGGAAVGGIGLFYPHVLGVGYESIEQALRGDMALGLLALLLLLKILATSTTIGSGGSGGVFAPSLFIGAMVGGTVGTLAHRWMPEIAASPGAYALVGMGALVAGTTHAPLTAILIIFELTSDYKLIVPLMAACMLSTLITTRLSRDSIYTVKLRRRGIDIRRGRDINVLRALKVAEVMSHDAATVPAGQSVGELIGLVADHPQSCFYVVGDDRRLEGVIVLAELRKILPDLEGVEALVALDLARTDLGTLSPQQDLDTVMRIFAGKNREELPVVEEGRMVGVVSRQHLLDAYNEELLKRDMVSELSSSLTATATEAVSLGGDFQMAEIDAPGAFVGRSIRDLDVRARFGGHILLLRRPAPSGGGQELEVIPEPDTVVARGDRLVLVARADALGRLRRL
jgi:CIC family chloride channel protein